MTVNAEQTEAPPDMDPAAQAGDEDPAKELAETPDPPTTETDEDKKDDAQADEKPESDEATTEAKGAEGDEEKARRRPSGVQRYQAKIERLERERETLMALASQRPPPPGAEPPPAKPLTPEEQVREYVRAEARAMARQELEAERAAATAAEQQRTWQTEMAAVAKETPDFQDLMEDARSLRVSDAVQEAMLTSGKGPRILVELARNPDELARLNALPPVQAAREIGRIEAKLAAGVTPGKTAPKSTATRPPAPPSNVGGSSASTKDIESLSISEYKRAYRSGRR